MNIDTAHGTFIIEAATGDDGALIVFIHTPIEPTADVVRVNVNDGPVYNYPDAVRWYGEDMGYPAPSID